MTIEWINIFFAKTDEVRKKEGGKFIAGSEGNVMFSWNCTYGMHEICSLYVNNIF